MKPYACLKGLPVLLSVAMAGCVFTRHPAHRSLSADEQKILQKQAIEQIQPLASSLLAAVNAATSGGDIAHALQICQQVVPQITRTANQNAADWQISRVAQRVRNPANQPDAWEQKVLTQFQQRLARGEPLNSLDYAEQTGGEYRYMKAIGVQPGCLACHGGNIKPEVQTAIRQLYPADRATGFKAGELRGAFSLRKPL